MNRAARTSTVSVCLPALNEAPTITPMVRILAALRAEGLIDEVLVIDGGSQDGTPAAAAAAGAIVLGWQDLRPELGPLLGKGDSMWRGLQASTGEIVCFFDADLVSFGREYVTRLLEPLSAEAGVSFVKSTFERPLRLASAPPGRRQGGRVTEAVGRPLLAQLYPELGRFRQPLSGQIAVRRDLLEEMAFPTGYGVDAALLIDSWRAAGLSAMREVDLGELLTVHQEATALERMADEVAAAILARAARDGIDLPPELERLRPAAGAAAPERPPVAPTRRPPVAQGVRPPR